MSKDLIKKENEIFCPECGTPIKRGMPSCPYCHYHIRQSTDAGLMPENGPPSGAVKIKIAGVLLSIFFGYWSWLYTYSKNKNKFWISFGILAVLYLIIIIYSFSLIFSTLAYGGYIDIFFSESLIGLNIFASILSFGIWVWSVVDNAIKPDNYYHKYPKY